MTPRYSGGDGRSLGIVRPLPQTTFRDLVRDVLGFPVGLPLTFAQFHALPKKDEAAQLDQDRAKRTGYLTPGYFVAEQRRLGNVEHCNLVFLDVDAAEHATRILERGSKVASDLAPYAFAIYRTASSTPELPRLRVVVAADQLPVASYRAAVGYVASLLGLDAVTSESCVASQPMFLPVLFKDQSPDTDHPLLYSNVEGRALTVIDLGDTPSVGITERGGHPTPTKGITDDFEHLCPRVDAVTLEDAREAVSVLDPDMDRKVWINVAAGLKHQFGDEGFEVWEEWSAKGTKFPTDGNLRTDWNSIRETPQGRAPVTIRSVLKLAREAGWQPDKLAERCFTATSVWLGDDERTDTELIKEGVARIAATPLLSPVERGVLIAKLAKELRNRDIPASLTDLKKGLRKAEAELKGKGGDNDEAPEDSALPKWLMGVTYVSDNNEFYRHSTGQRWSVDAFNNAFSRYLITNGEEDSGGRPPVLPQHYALNIAKIKVVDHFIYAPEVTKPHVERDNRTFINTYRPSYEPETLLHAEEVGDAIWRHTLTQFGVEADARHLIDWMAYIVQNPGQKVLWAPVLQGAEGTGKSFYYVLMNLVLGESNTKLVKGNVVMNSDWNDWAAECQLVFLNEVRIVGKSRHLVMDKLKDLITDLRISINQKRQDTRMVRNYANYLISTNYQDALAINKNDRRYFVLFAKQQTAEEIQAVWPHPYFPNLYDLVREKAGSLRGWLLNWKLSDDFTPTRCPTSSHKAALVEQSASPLHRAIEEALLDGDNPLCRHDIVSLRVLRDIVETENRGLERFHDQTMTSILREMNYEAVGRIRLNGGEKHSVWCRGLDPKVAEALAKTRSNGEEDLL